MTKKELKDAASRLRAILALLATLPADARSSAAADLRRGIGSLSADAEPSIASGAFAVRLGACFTAARSAGATFAGMGRVDALVASASVSNTASVAVSVAALRFALIEQALIVADTTFTSRSDVETIQAALNASFEVAIEYAAEAKDQEVFRALTSLFAAVTRDLQQRSRPLPRMVTYNLPSLPSLALANRLYGDADRADELRAENRSPHPLFMAPIGRALSA